jgi:hypothetical protein
MTEKLKTKLPTQNGTRQITKGKARTITGTRHQHQQTAET